MINYQIISTGSKGNAIIYNDNILVDVGVPFIKLKDVLPNVKIILLTHQHHDHINYSTVKRIHKLYPKIKFFGGVWLRLQLESCGIEDYQVLDYDKVYNLGFCKLSLVRAIHDVPNCGYRIFINDDKIIHITDTYTMEGIIAKEYSIYGLEFHHSESDIVRWIEEKESQGKFAYEKGAINSHLSFEKAEEWLNENKGEESVVLKLHMSSKYEQI